MSAANIYLSVRRSRLASLSVVMPCEEKKPRGLGLQHTWFSIIEMVPGTGIEPARISPADFRHTTALAASFEVKLFVRWTMP